MQQRNIPCRSSKSRSQPRSRLSSGRRVASTRLQFQRSSQARNSRNHRPSLSRTYSWPPRPRGKYPEWSYGTKICSSSQPSRSLPPCEGRECAETRRFALNIWCLSLSRAGNRWGLSSCRRRCGGSRFISRFKWWWSGGWLIASLREVWSSP